MSPPVAVNGDAHHNIPKDYQPDVRVEPVPRPDFPHHKYPRWIGHKFNPSGSVLPYPGNTVLAHLSADSPLRRGLSEMYEDVQKQDFAPLLTLLPQSSWHMTLYEGVTDRIRIRHSYPGDIPLESSLKVCHAHVASRLADFEHGLGEEGVGRMTVVGFEPIDDGIGLKLGPATSDKEVKLRNVRDRLSERLRMRHPGHENYSWHMAFAYVLRPLMPEHKQQINDWLAIWKERLPDFELGLPEFCVYDDMFQFRRVFYLNS